MTRSEDPKADDIPQITVFKNLSINFLQVFVELIITKGIWDNTWSKYLFSKTRVRVLFSADIQCLSFTQHKSKQQTFYDIM